MGKYKHGKPNKEISIPEFINYLKNAKFLKLSHKAWFVLVYWIGCRRTEPLNIVKEDITEKDNILFLEIPAKKDGERGGKIELPMHLPGMEIVKKRWMATRKKRRLFPFETSTSWRIIKRIDETLSPHWFRHNRLTKFRRLLDQGKISKDDIKSFTGIKSDRTIENYGMVTQDGVHRASKVLNVE